LIHLVTEPQQTKSMAYKFFVVFFRHILFAMNVAKSRWRFWVYGDVPVPENCSKCCWMAGQKYHCEHWWM